MQFTHFCLLFRNQAVGTCSLVARIGGIVSLLLNLLKVRNLVAWCFTKDKFKLALSHEVVLQNYDVGDVLLSVFSYAIALDNTQLVTMLISLKYMVIIIYFVFSGYNFYILIKMNVNEKYVNS